MTARQDQIFVRITEQMCIFLWMLLDKRGRKLFVLSGIHFPAFFHPRKVKVKAVFDQPFDIGHICSSAVIAKAWKIRVWRIK